jgi:hypothetical protein
MQAQCRQYVSEAELPVVAAALFASLQLLLLPLLFPLLSCPTDKAMQDVFGAEYVSLHVRVSNKGAIHLYTQTLGYE